MFAYKLSSTCVESCQDLALKSTLVLLLLCWYCCIGIVVMVEYLTQVSTPFLIL
jgi:hypothetical protein